MMPELRLRPLVERFGAMLLEIPVFEAVYGMAHSTAKCNGEIFGVEENLTRSSVAEYLSGTRVEYVLDPLDIGIGYNREIGTFWEVLSEQAVGVFVEATFPRVIGFGKIG